MVSGFLISPYDQDRIFSGDAIEIRIWSKTWAGVVGLNRFIISWFMLFSSRAGQSRQQIRKFSCVAGASPVPRAKRRSPGVNPGGNVCYSAASDVVPGPT